jgi:hypothetical protein
MKAGNSIYEVGTRIKIKRLSGEDSFLSGQEGILTHPFGCYGDLDVGVRLNNGEICNLSIEDFDILN